MIFTKEQLEKIKATIDFIINKYEWFADYGEDLELKAEDIDEYADTEAYELPSFNFPGEENEPEITAEYFLKIADEIPSIEIIDNSIIKTKLLRYYIVEAPDSFQENVLRNTHYLKLELPNKTEIDLVTNNFIIGLAAVELEEYESDYWGAVSPYIAIEIKYNSDNDVLPQDKEIEIVKSFIFEVADSTDIALNFSEIRNPVHDYEDLDEEDIVGQLRELENYNEGMRLFVSAIQIKEDELKFLNFYKILEHFAPVAVNIEANELMRKKLDAPKSAFEDGDFIRSIFDLAKSMREKFNDEDLIKSTFLTCFDFINLFEKLPDSIKTKVKKQIGEKNITYSIDRQKTTTAANMVSKIIYATRNKVVHAKSNFEINGNECPSADISVLNKFMKEACSQTIRWYNRQPKHLKLTIIQ